MSVHLEIAQVRSLMEWPVRIERSMMRCMLTVDRGPGRRVLCEQPILEGRNIQEMIDHVRGHAVFVHGWEPIVPCEA